MNTATTQLALSVLGTAGFCFFSLAPANAVILVEPLITRANPNFPDGTVLTPDFLPNTPAFWSAPDESGDQNFVNATGRDITRFSFLLITPQFEGEDVVWGDANGDGQIGLPDFFSSFVINPDNPQFQQLDVTEGSIPNNTRFVVKFISNPDLNPPGIADDGPLLIAGLYDGVLVTTVPESSTTWGLLLLGMGYVGTKAWKNRRGNSSQ